MTVRIVGIYEAVVYADDVAETVSFYTDVLGLRLVEPVSSLMGAIRLRDAGMLLVFNRAEAAEPGRNVPSHGTTGQGHVAFRVEAGSHDVWRARLLAAGVAIERDVRWGSGARSIYVRDPAGNSVELVDGEIWPA